MFRCVECKEKVGVKSGDIYYTKTVGNGFQTLCQQCATRAAAWGDGQFPQDPDFGFVGLGWTQQMVQRTESEKRARALARDKKIEEWERKYNLSKPAKDGSATTAAVAKSAEKRDAAIAPTEKEMVGPTEEEMYDAIKRVEANPNHYGTVVKAVMVNPDAYDYASPDMQGNYAIIKATEAADEAAVKRDAHKWRKARFGNIPS